MGAPAPVEVERTTIVTTLMFAFAYGAAFGAIQQIPQIVPGLPEVRQMTSGRPAPEARAIEQRVASDVTKIQEVGATPPVALEDASLSTWIHPTDGTAYIYYDKGSLVGLLLDILIRDRTANRGSLDAVMRGAGRMSDAGWPIEWGVGRHGPGNNVFAYFVGPDDFVIEYTADVQQVDDSYKVGAPSDWTWPPGRFDQWGVSKPPSDRIKQAQKKIRFIE